MSRLIVKNLPKNITESKIREIFSAKGNITDIQLKYTKDGKFRQFAFIGYHNEDGANEAIETFHNSHISTNKIVVEACAMLGDAQKPKSWSKYAPDSSAYKRSHPQVTEEGEAELEDEKPTKKKKKSKEVELLEKYKSDPQFEEYLQLHSSKEAQKLLNNIQTENKSDPEESENGDGDDDDAEKTQNESKLANQDISDAEYMKTLMKKTDTSKEVTNENNTNNNVKKIDLFTVKLRNLPCTCKKKDIKDFFKPLAPYSIRIPRNIKGIAYVGFKTEKKLTQALLKDCSFIKGKRITVVKYSSKTENHQEERTDLKNMKWKTQAEAIKHEEDIAESGRIFLRNLSYTTTEDDIQGLFSKYGPITEINLPVDMTTRKLKGFGIVTFLMPEHAVKAYTELDGSIVHGRMLHLLPGKAKDAPEEEEQDSSNYKRKKASKQTAQAGQSHNWNSLFLGHDAVADVIAKQYGTSKENVLNPHGDGSAAVRLALGETQIVASTRKFLEQKGVLLDAFSGSNTKRSKMIILVKNLPVDTKPSEIREIFEKYGVLSRVILPPSGITAIVEYIEPSEARKAFTNLAYKKFKHLPLYLEWAPENSLTVETTDQAINKKEAESDDVKQVTQEKEVEEQEEVCEEEPEPDTTLFVKNLNFQTTDDLLREHFETCGKINYAMVATKKDKNDPKNRLSMGYGFVRYYHKANADKALKTLQCSTLDGKTLELKRSERTLQNDVKSAKKPSRLTKQTGTKILVRNVPFQATQKEIMELFKTFGEIKALRLPKKLSGGENAHRGFAFVDFITNSDAKKAFEALSQSTHLYGRRLVLEWASTNEGIEEIRKKTAEHFHEKKKARSKKSVLDIEKI